MDTSVQKKKKKIVNNIVLRMRADRRLLPNVPDPSGVRHTDDRRRSLLRKTLKPNEKMRRKRNVLNPSLAEHQGIRYIAEYKVQVICLSNKNQKKIIIAESDNISTTGILLRIRSEEDKLAITEAKTIKLKFKVAPGSMPEGYEMKVNISASCVRTDEHADGTCDVGFSFERSLVNYVYEHRGRSLRTISITLLAVLSLTVVLMRVQSVIYFQFNMFLYFYSIITATYLLSRYLFGAFYKPTPINDEFKPGVSIIIPCFNEEEWIQRTILGCINQNYPSEMLEVIVVDDCSNDNSVQKIEELIQELYEKEERYNIKERLHCIKQEENQGKRAALARGVKTATHDLVVFVDSDSFLDQYAILNLVQPFQDLKMGGVTGRTDVANAYTNALTKMQSVRYYIAFRIMKAAESYFDAVTCLSGPLSCYRKDIVIENMDKWLFQQFMGKKATFGDDRAMTNFVLSKHRTSYQDTAICSTIVPNRYKIFLKQQMRWKRSWMRESSVAATYMWRKEPLMAVSFYMGFLIPIAAPIVVIYNLLFVPIVFGLLPLTFLFGLFVMAMMMSMAQMLLRRNSIWIYGLVFCFFYVFVLLWQMPVAWVTFWKSTWGTRLTSQDLARSEKRRLRHEVDQKIGAVAN